VFLFVLCSFLPVRLHIASCLCVCTYPCVQCRIICMHDACTDVCVCVCTRFVCRHTHIRDTQCQKKTVHADSIANLNNKRHFRERKRRETSAHCEGFGAIFQNPRYRTGKDPPRSDYQSFYVEYMSFYGLNSRAS